VKRLARRALGLLPGFIAQPLRAFYRRLDAMLKAYRRASITQVNTEALVAALRSAGVREGDTIMVHSSLSRIGNVKGSADAVIRSLTAAVTPEGTVLMPAYGSADTAQADYAQGTPVDLRTRRSQTGAITEKFRTWPDVSRSSHPFSSVCAWGRHADYITSAHDTDPRICHKDSPIGRLVELGGKVVGIGVSLGPISIYHVIEDTWEEFPFRVYSDPFRMEYIDAVGDRVTRDVVRYDQRIAATRIDREAGAWIRDQFTAHFERKGILQRFRFGSAESWVMDTGDLCAELKRLAGGGITMYLTRDEWTARNGGSASTGAW
jgi:aminoglycoside 3-N-acetyltransferase